MMFKISGLSKPVMTSLTYCIQLFIHVAGIAARYVVRTVTWNLKRTFRLSIRAIKMAGIVLIGTLVLCAMMFLWFVLKSGGPTDRADSGLDWIAATSPIDMNVDVSPTATEADDEDDE